MIITIEKNAIYANNNIETKSSRKDSKRLSNLRRLVRSQIYCCFATITGLALLFTHYNHWPIDLLFHWTPSNSLIFEISITNWIIAIIEDEWSEEEVISNILLLPTEDFQDYYGRHRTGLFIHHIATIFAYSWCLSTHFLAGLCVFGLLFEIPVLLVNTRDIMASFKVELNHPHIRLFSDDMLLNGSKMSNKNNHYDGGGDSGDDGDKSIIHTDEGEMIDKIDITNNTSGSTISSSDTSSNNSNINHTTMKITNTITATRHRYYFQLYSYFFFFLFHTTRTFLSFQYPLSLFLWRSQLSSLPITSQIVYHILGLFFGYMNTVLWYQYFMRCLIEDSVHCGLKPIEYFWFKFGQMKLDEIQTAKQKLSSGGDRHCSLNAVMIPSCNTSSANNSNNSNYDNNGNYSNNNNSSSNNNNNNNKSSNSSNNYNNSSIVKRDYNTVFILHKKSLIYGV